MKLSYIITSYNRPGLLENAVACIVAEKIEDSELVVVDDCSDLPVVMPGIVRDAFPNTHQLIRNPKNRGVIGARNAGVAAARGEFVLFLDDDDRSAPNRSRDLLDAISTQGTDFVAAHAVMHTRTGARIVPVATGGALTPMILLLNPPHIDAVIWRRNFLLETRGLDGRIPYFGEHVTLMLGLMRGKTGYLSEKTVAHFGYLEGGLTENVRRQNRLKQDLQAYFQLLTEASADPTLTTAFLRVSEMLKTTEIASYDDFLERLYGLFSP